MNNVGLHYGLEEAVYHALPYVSNSDLNLFRESPFHYWSRKLAPDAPPREDSEALFFGRALHCAFLEPERFDQAYVEAPDLDGRTKEYKEWKRNLAEGTIVLTAKHMKDIRGIIAEIMKIPLLQKIRGETENEVSIRWKDPKTGLKCRARLDALHRGRKMVIDLKSTRRLKAFDNSAFQYYYHCQAPWYLDGLREALTAEGEDPEGWDFLFVAAERNYPYASGLFFFSAEAMEFGAEQNRGDLERLKQCMDSGEWPATDEKANEIPLPPYMKKKTFNFEEILDEPTGSDDRSGSEDGSPGLS